MIGAKIYVGVDPGMKGAMAFFDPAADTLDVFPMPTFHVTRTSGRGANLLDLIQLARIIDNELGWDRKASVWIEMVNAKPGEGLSSAFNFGFGTGALHGLFAAHFLPIQIIAPVRWKRALECPADKDGARQRASQLFPRHAHNWPLKQDDGKAEAALIALYGSKHDVRT